MGVWDDIGYPNVQKINNYSWCILTIEVNCKVSLNVKLTDKYLSWTTDYLISKIFLHLCIYLKILFSPKIAYGGISLYIIESAKTTTPSLVFIPPAMSIYNSLN